MEEPVNYGATNNNVNGKVSERGDHPETASTGDVRPEWLGEMPGTGATPGVMEEASGEQEEDLKMRRTENRLDTVCVIGFCLGLIGFLATFHLKAFSRRLPYPLVGNIQDMDPTLKATHLWQDGVNLIPAVWGVRYIRKIGLTLFNLKCLVTHDYNNPAEVAAASGDCTARASWWPWYILPVVLYHGGLSFWVGMATNYYLPYQVSDVEWIIGGLVVFLVGELTVVVRTLLARRAQVKAREAGRNPGRFGVVGMGRVVEAGEVVSCVGFAAFTLTLPACLMALVRLGIAIPACMGRLHGKAF